MSQEQQLEALEKQLSEATQGLEQCNNEQGRLVQLLKRAAVYEALGRLDLARADVQTVIKIDPTHKEAKQTAQRLFTATTAKDPSPPIATDPQVEEFQGYLRQVTSGDIKAFVHSPAFVQVLTVCGTPGKAADIRATAFMILTTLFNPGPREDDRRMGYLIEQCALCFTRCMDSGKNVDKLLAYRTLHAIFQTSMTVGAAILCQEGTVEEMMDVVEFEVPEVQISIVDVLAIASSDKTCQKLIVQYGSRWLTKVAASESSDERLKATAGTTLTKLRMQKEKQDDNASLDSAMRRMKLESKDLVESLVKVLKTQSQDQSVVLSAVEGLAYSSLETDVKETLINDNACIKALVTLTISTANTNNNPLLFGVGTILSNLTMYRPVLDEQQQQMKKLRDLANAKQGKKASNDTDARESDAAVDRRVQLAIEGGAALALMVLAKNTSANMRQVAAQTYLNLVTPQPTRGRLLQRGVIRGLLPLATQKDDAACALIASQALAKLAITADPRIAFGQQSIDLVRPFLNLCKDDKQLRQFEGLMALTNLASVDDQIRLKIVDEDGLVAFENLQLSSHTMIQRAATEMICNMTFCDPVFESYSDPAKPGAQNKIRLLMIFADHEDVATRCAASGALAILANSKGACDMMAQVDRGYNRITQLLNKDEPVDVQHRGIEILRCMIQHLEKEAIDAFVAEGAHVKLVDVVKTCQATVVRGAAVEVLKMFVEHGVQLKP
ncbi:Protein unc-45 A [Apophysomyces sp. BC1034]|nr:Protein unc-45 A [Apophysomyces sp. BC1015]KAG0180066.1 Protein unc-45 A [Apophysomyces sp. BC1021]KAG0190574.1 Protein unc-45 A [Apophysomyces sp. BC1034]